MLQSATPIPEQEIRNAVDRAFRSASFGRLTPLGRFWMWLNEQFAHFLQMLSKAFRHAGGGGPVGELIIVLGIAALLVILARIIWLWRARTRVGVAAGGWGIGGIQRGADPWTLAQSLAARGDYTAAAHALYAALLESAARGQQVRLHPSKTAGDYAREMRARRSQLFTRFRAFAIHYEVVIYGDQMCDRERYDRLFALAVPMLRSDG
jgi:hypothetical protein